MGGWRPRCSSAELHAINLESLRQAAPMATSKELSMTEPLLIPCPHCNGLNRIPGDRLG